MTPRQSRSSGCGCEAQPRALCMQPRAAEAGRSWTVTRAVAAPTATLPAMPCCHDRCTATPTAPIPAAANSCLALRPQIAHRSWRAGTHACSGGARARSPSGPCRPSRQCGGGGPQSKGTPHAGHRHRQSRPAIGWGRGGGQRHTNPPRSGPLSAPTGLTLTMPEPLSHTRALTCPSSSMAADLGRVSRG